MGEQAHNTGAVLQAHGTEADLIEKLAKGSGKSAKEIERLIAEKKGKFSGMLTDEGAAMLVAKDLNIKGRIADGTEVKIAKLAEGMQNVDLTARVLRVYEPKRFEKDGRKGELCNLLVADDSGEIRLTLWNKDVKKLKEGNVERGSVLFLRNCYVTAYNEKPQLNLSFNGEFIANPSGADEKSLPKAEARAEKLGALKAGMNDIDVYGKVLRVFDEKSFESNERKGRLINFLMHDGKDIVRATAWNDGVEKAGKLKRGEIIKVEGAYTKAGMKGIELHLGWSSRIIREPKGIEIAELPEIEAEEKKIAEIDEGMTVMVKGKINDIRQGSLHYLVCPKCLKKVERVNEGFVCSACGEVKKPEIRQFCGFGIEDSSGLINAVCFGEACEKLLGFGKDELKKRLDEKGAEGVVEDLRDELNGKEVSVEGKVRRNSFSDSLELMVRKVI